MTFSKPRRIALALAGAALLLTTAACGGSGDGGSKTSGADIQKVLTAAKTQFDQASSVKFTMATGSTPTSGNAVLGAKGTLTHQPAFKGDVKVLFSGFNTSIPVVSVDGKVYAKLPLTPSYSTIDPSEYGAPDPSDFADPAKGISGLLLKLDGAKQTGQKRDGKIVVTTYSGTLSGSLVAPIIPSADETGTYKTVVGIDGDGRITTLSVTGDFFAGSGDVTYDLTFYDYGKNVTIKKP
ncbi:LppX_LprAFG lipoprotein [Nocardioides marmorisolisilvae]|uniref:LppX_LprAFG lipoprotein n=1 Tax=Nocardioides marmorisolisilvae TaxID=1542737 RepID=A0A3N0DVH4_9ACTN|nr:LppX_LprAFG lipoprotein [Nocardioides marmorisolisilvae]RNL79620.1 LppX_LprAFG lipoprotein [Nocardioides marmorisolisilvae]